jgi:thymidylate synthase
MARTYIAETTVDDLMRAVIEEIQRHGERISPTKGDAVELTGVLLELTNPRARLSQTETRGKPYSCLGELCWYLAKTNDLSFIFYYLPQYKKYADGNEIFGGYGPRLFNWKGTDQISNITSLLRRNPDSRKAVIQLFDAQDIVENHKDVPCTCTMQFMLRGDSLHMFTNMRSNDALWGVAHDFFCFTMLQEIIARDLGVDVGTYKHAVGSLHLYDESIETAKRFLGEGWQSTEATMPAMPIGDPWPGIATLLKAESIIRTGGTLDSALLSGTDPYWADLIRLLEILRYKKAKDAARITEVRATMSSKIYDPFIDKALSRLE